MPRGIKAPYGYCAVCNSPVAIPGGDGYKCGGECGWVAKSEIDLLIRKKNKKQKNNPQKAESGH